MKTSSAGRLLFPAGGTWGRQGWVSERVGLWTREDIWGRRGGWWDAEEGPLWMDERSTGRRTGHL